MCEIVSARNICRPKLYNMGLRIVLLFGVSLFTTALCFREDEVTKESRTAENGNRPGLKYLILQRTQRQTFIPGFPSARAQARAPTVIVVPERGTIPAYGNVPISPYTSTVNSPNRGTTVVVSQIPEYNYNGIGRNYDVLPVNPIRI